MEAPSPSPESIFFAALAKGSSEERAAYLEEACGEDRELRRRVERLLAAHPEVGGFLDLDGPPQTNVALEELAPQDQPGAQIGPYKLLQVIGEGGMGVVYMAQQTHPVERRVALKIVKPGMGTRQVIARFEAERQALALMDHPNIAKVLDAATENGRPYFVMELVKGVPVTQYCDEHQLTPRQRLELFIPVCQAVQHAHQKGVIHRDLKPTNVLVAEYDERAVPKVIDFGVAKAVGPKLTDKTFFTEFGQVVGTIEYMSPEQAKLNQLDIDTRTDVYSLGVLLYELLTGETPFDRQRLRAAAFDEMLRIIREEEPAPPSTRLNNSVTLQAVAANRRTEPKKLSLVVRGELDWIVMKALDKDRNRRYETAGALADDLERYLRDEPVVACPPSHAYRLRKFARRHRATVTATALVAASLILGTAVSVWQMIEAHAARRLADQRLALARERLKSENRARQEAETQRRQAQQNLAQAREAVKKYFTVVSENRLLDVPGLEPLRRDLLESALDYYRLFLRESQDDPAAQAELAAAYVRVGQIQADLDAPEESLTAFENGLAIVEKLLRQRRSSDEALRQLAGVYSGGRSPHRSTRPPPDPVRIRRLVERGIRIWEDLVRTDPAAPGFQSDLAALYALLGELQAGFGERNEALQSLETSRAMRRRLVRQRPDAPHYQADLAASCDRAGLLLQTAGKTEEALAAYRESLELAQRLVEDFPDAAHYRELLASGQYRLGALMGKMKPAEAEEMLRQSLESYRQLSRQFPAVPAYREDTAVNAFDLANLLSETGRAEEAVAMFHEAIALMQRLAEDAPHQSDLRRRLASYHYHLGLHLNRAGRIAEARESYAHAAAIRDRLIAESPGVGRYWEELAWQLASCPDEERRDARRAAALALQAVELSPTNPSCWRTLGVAQYRLGEYDSARKSLETALSLSPSSGGSAAWFLAMTLWRLGEKEEARKYYDQTRMWMEQNRPNDADLLRFRAEAEELLDVSAPSSRAPP